MSSSQGRYEHRRMENDVVALEIFDPLIHGPRFVKEQQTTNFLRYVPYPQFKAADDFTDFFNRTFGPDSDPRLYAVIDKTRVTEKADLNPTYAGVTGFRSQGYEDATMEIGAMIFPAFHGTHVAANAVGLMLMWALDPPSLGGLGLRRVEWKAHANNDASRRFAEKMGFVLEGIARWERLAPEGELSLSVEALEKRNGRKESMGRHTAIFSLVWDEWDGKRPALVTRMERRR